MTKRLFFAFDETSLSWLSIASSLYSSLDVLAEDLVAKPSLYADFIHYYVVNKKYRVFLKLRTNEMIEMKTIELAISNL